jgi:peptidoglycan hydrolase-like protein with peptidoglycan-binding domain
MALFKLTKQDRDYYALQDLLKPKEDQQEETAGIGTKPSKQEQDEESTFINFFNGLFDRSEQRAQEIAKEAKESALAASLTRELSGITKSLTEEDVAVRSATRDPRYGNQMPEETTLVDVTDTDKGKLTNVKPLYEMSEEIDPGTIDTESLDADGGASTSGKGLMSPVDDAMGLPTTPSKEERELSGSVKRVQQKLTDLGYKPKGIDGVIGGGTRRAIRKFQKANDLPITGELTQEVLDIIDSGNAPKYFDPPKPNAKVDSFTDQSFTIFSDAIADKESSNRYNITGGANDHYLGRYQMGKDALADVGRGYNAKLNKEFLNNPELQDKLFKKYTLMNHKHLTKNSKRYREMSQQEKLGVLGYAHNQGATAAEEWLYTGVSGADAFGTKGDEYTSLVGKAFNDYLKDLKPQLRPDEEEV